MMGSPRSGSTWLLRMLSHHQRVLTFDEPFFGHHLAPPAAPDRTIASTRATLPDYCLSSESEEVWRPLLRALILNRVRWQVERESRARAIDRPLAVLKEPNSSHAADLIMSLVPDSRLVFLIRDGRDVIDSLIDATSGDTWLGGFDNRNERDRLVAVRVWAQGWLHNTSKVQQAFAQHAPERRFAIRYEQLLADPLPTLGGLLRWAGLETSEDRLHEFVSRESFSTIPPEERGQGKFFRAATPGLWRENLSAAEQELMTELIGEKLDELGYRD